MTIEQNNTPAEPTVNGFAAFNLPHALMKSLEHMKYTSPTPVQSQAIPAAMKGKDVLGSAQTGTGKTAAFLIPVLSRLLTDMHASCLVMTPTRELAAQILVVARQMLFQNNTIKTALLIGGESMGRQRAQLSGKPRLIVGTPGRINDHLRNYPTLFKTVNMLVLDEADRMLDMGFTPQINEVIKNMPAPNRQTLMFSATFPKEIIAFTQKYMNDPIRVTIEPERTSAANIIHESIETSEKTRYDDLMNELHDRKGTIIVFVKTKHGADRITLRLEKDGHSVAVIHGGLSQRQRDRAIANFRNKTTRIMIATDVAARGLDVPHIEHVINYDLPQVAEDYVHRIGRTARNGQEGRALSFLMPSERGKWNAIQRLLNPGQKQERSGGRSNGGRSGGRNGGGGFRGRNRDFGHTDREFEQQPQSQGHANEMRSENRPGDSRGGPAREVGNRDFGQRRENNNGGQRRDFGNRDNSNRDFKRRDDRPQRQERSSYNPMANESGEPNFNVEGANERKPYQNKGGFKGRSNNNGGGFKGPKRNYNDRPAGQFNERPAPRRDNFNEGPERNFNSEGAGGEKRFDRDNDRPFGERKPAGKFFKKKFFGKDKGSKPGNKNGGKSGFKRPLDRAS